MDSLYELRMAKFNSRKNPVPQVVLPPSQPLQPETPKERRPKFDPEEVEDDEIIDVIIDEQPPTSGVRTLMKKYISRLVEDDLEKEREDELKAGV